MGTSAELDGRTELNDTYMVAVFLAKKGDGSQLLGFLNGDVAVFLQRNIGANLGVDQVFYLADFLIRHLLEVREVETQRVGSNQ